MSTNFISLYVGSNISNGTTCSDILEELKKVQVKKFRNPKLTLSLIRNLTAFEIVGHADDELMKSLIAIAKDIADNDVERKILRTIVHFLVSVVGSDVAIDKEYQRDLVTLVKGEISSQSGSRLCLAWKVAGSLSTKCESNDEISTMIEHMLRKMAFPVKPKQVSWGQKSLDKEYESRLGIWRVLLSALRRIGKHPVAELMPSIFVAASSGYPSCSRHAFALLGRVAKARDQCANESAAFVDKFSENSEAWKKLTDEGDLLSITYLMTTVSSMAQNKNFNTLTVAEMCAQVLRFIDHRR